jgi:hypothetical protein
MDRDNCVLLDGIVMISMKTIEMDSDNGARDLIYVIMR